MVIIIMAVIIMAVAGVVVIKAAGVMAPGKGSGKNPEKFSPRKKRGFPSGFPTQKRVQIRVISAPINTSPAQKKNKT